MRSRQDPLQYFSLCLLNLSTPESEWFLSVAATELIDHFNIEILH